MANLFDIFDDFEIIEIPPTPEDRERDKFDFYDRFTKAEDGGIESVKECYNTILAEAKQDYQKITELYIVVNHKVWEHNEQNTKLAHLYYDFQKAVYQWVDENLSADEAEYFYSLTD